MSTERLFKIILTDLGCDRLKLEEELERIINSDLETNDKVEQVKSIISRISIVDASLSQLMSMMNYNTKEINNENGKV
jgi:hypothetical protein